MDSKVKTRWLGVLAAVALIALIVPVHETPTEDAPPETASACEPDAKPANLDFTLRSVSGEEFSLAAQKGKVILLSFWATWCGPCTIEIPWLVDLQSRYGGRGFVVVGVSVDDSVGELRPFVERMKMNYPVVLGAGRDDVKEEAYGPLWGVPTAFLIGRDGRVCRKHTGMASPEQLEQEIKALL
jgi:peroxiredoxin